MTLMMTSAQVVETSVNVTNNSPSRDYSHPDDQTTQTTDTPGFKPFIINSLVSHIDDLRVVMSQFKDIDILAINETKLDATIKDGEVHLPGYDVVRKDREGNGRNGGGVCIYIRNNINFQLRADLSPNNLECLTVEISKPRSKPFLVSTWYRPPQSSPDLFSTFERIIDKIDAENLELYLMGDLSVTTLLTF